MTTEEAEAKAPRTHWDMLLERRTRAELEELLQERLELLRARRGQTRRPAAARSRLSLSSPVGATSRVSPLPA